MYIPESITFRNCQCNVFWLYVAIIIAAAIETTVVSDCMLLIWNIVSWKKKSRFSYVFPLIFMFCYSRFRFRNLKDDNSCMFSWCITTRSLLICSWHDMTLSQFVQQLYSIYGKYLPFASISYVQESFKLNEVNHG